MARTRKPRPQISENAQVTVTETETAGRIVRRPDGKFAPGTRPVTAITTANAREMAEKRAEKYRKAAVERIAGELAAMDPTIRTPADAYGFIAARQAVALLDSERPRIEDLQRLRDIMTGTDAIKRQSETPANTETADIIRSLAQFAASIIPNNTHYMESSPPIDGQIIPPAPLPAGTDTDRAPAPDTGTGAGTPALGTGHWEQET